MQLFSNMKEAVSRSLMDCCSCCNGTGVLSMDDRDQAYLHKRASHSSNSYKLRGILPNNMANGKRGDHVYTNAHDLELPVSGITKRSYERKNQSNSKGHIHMPSFSTYDAVKTPDLSAIIGQLKQSQAARSTGNSTSCEQHVQPIHRLRMMRRQNSQHRSIGGGRMMREGPFIAFNNQALSNSSRMMLKARESIDHRIQATNMSDMDHDCCSQNTCGNLVAGFAMLQECNRTGQPCYTEPIFTSYYTSDLDEYWKDENDDLFDISFTNFDFRTLSGDFTDDVDDNPTSLIDMICGTSSSSDEQIQEVNGDLQEVISSEPLQQVSQSTANLQNRRTSTTSTRRGRGKKAKVARVPKEHNTSTFAPNYTSNIGTCKIVVKNNNEDDPNDDRIEWHPGFSRQLGAKGRSAILDLVRRVYRQDPNHYKAILQARNPPSSISNLPFFNIPMLWELTHQFGVFPQALALHRNQQSASMKGDRNRSKAKADKGARPANSPSQTLEKVVEPQLTMHSQEEIISQDTMERLSAPQKHAKRSNTHLSNMLDSEHVEKYHVTKAESSHEVVKSGMTSFSGRSIKPSRRYAEYQDGFVKPATKLVGENDHRVESDYSESYTPTCLHTNEQSLDSSQVFADQTSEKSSAKNGINALQLSPKSLLWRVTQQLVANNEEDKEINEALSPVSSARSTPKRCISV